MSRSRRMARALAAVGLIGLSCGPVAATGGAAEERSPAAEMLERVERDQRPPKVLGPEHLTPCLGGMAGEYPCSDVDLLEFLPLSAIGGGGGSDIWGWTDPVTGREYALMGRTNGTAFVDVTDPTSSVYVGNLPTHTVSSTWRDIKTYADHAFIVSEAIGHGMQVFDLTRLRDVVNPPVTFAETAHFSGFGSAHNIVINEDSGFAYAVGTNTCAGGLTMVDIQDPLVPTFAGCFSADGYTHDAQCVAYHGPDVDHSGQEICLGSNEDTLTIVDVTSKAAPVMLSRTGYAGSGYTHQGWLTEDHAYFLLDDELDEQSSGHNTYTYVWDVSDLDNPVLVGHHTSPTPAIDHNLYVRGPFVFQANYRSGLRILRLDDPSQAMLTEVGFFDVYPENDQPSFTGAWSVYPYFASGTVVVSSIDRGLFVLRPLGLCEIPDPPAGLAATANGANRIDLAWTGSGAAGATFVVERALGGCGATFEVLAEGLSLPAFADTSASGWVTYGYRVREEDAGGACRSEPSTCVEASTSGDCTAPPAFAGLATATSPGTLPCQVELAWEPATLFCDGPVSYAVYRSTQPDFEPDPSVLVADGVTGTAYTDHGPPSLQQVHYVVRARDESNGAQESNLERRSARAQGPVADGTFFRGAEVGEPDRPGEPPDHVGWEVSTARWHAGERSFFSTYNDSMCESLTLGPITLSPGQSPELSFWTAWDIESGWDGGRVEVSSDGGSSWAAVGGAGFYPGTISSSGNQCGFAAGTPVFTGTGQLATWQSRSVSLAPYAGLPVLVRWRFSTDGSVTREGWYVDDITITHAQVPGSCFENLLFSASFEGGTTGEWSAVVP